jgi:hypothetical protein
MGGTTAPPPPGSGPTDLPKATAPCPDFRTGTMTFNGINLQVWAGTPPASGPGGPLVFYWHGTGTTSGEAQTALGSGINEIMAEGGVVASFIDTTSGGAVSGGTIWFNDDLKIADEIVACAIEKQKIDTRRIHSSGYSAGGLQSGAMMTQRSNYLASALIYSGGVISAIPNPDPSNAPAVMCAHGATGSDWLALDFAEGCKSLESSITAKGGFAIDCDDGGSHVSLTRFAVADFGWKFLKAHPYKTTPSPWASMLPAGAPQVCKIWK